MKSLLVAAAFFLLAAQCACAASNRGATLSCGSFSVPLDSFYLELSNVAGANGASSESQYVSITTDIAQFETLFTYQVTQKHLSDCYVVQAGQQDTQSLRLIDVFVRLVSLTGNAKSRYVTAALDFAKIELPAGSSSASAKGTTALTPEQQNKALTEFLARAPKPNDN